MFCRTFRRLPEVAAVGHEVTLNGFGVMMSSVTNDPFVRGWIQHVVDQTTTTTPKEEETPQECRHQTPFRALELGCAFGVASLTALDQHVAASTCQQQACSSVPRLEVVANDMERKHLDEVVRRWQETTHNMMMKGDPEKKKKNTAAPRLTTWHGRVPECLLQSARAVAGGSAELHHHLRHQKQHPQAQEQAHQSETAMFDTENGGAFHAVLCANVLHFLKPHEVHDTFNTLHKLCAPGARLFVSLDSPFTRAYLPFLPAYYLRRNLLRSDDPGASGISPFLKKFVVPKRLSGVDFYNVQEPRTLRSALEKSGWEVQEARLFSADVEGNPKGVSLGNGCEMVGAVAVRRK